VVGFAALTPSVTSDQAYDPPDPGPTPHDTVENLDRLRVLGTLPERERIALIRTMVDGDAAADIAKDLGVSTDRVYTLVHNGSTRVRRRAT
jgi:DNA-directed RNA polymerase specialized sigma24 family protein